MLDPEKTRDREALLKRLQELYREIDEGRKRFCELKTKLNLTFPSMDETGVTSMDSCGGSNLYL